MSAPTYLLTADGVRNPFRGVLALWRALRDPDNVYEAKLAEITFACSWPGRRFARWHAVADALRQDPVTAKRLAERHSFGPIDVDALVTMGDNTLGGVLAQHCRRCGHNPNLILLKPSSEEEWILDVFYQTHDIWHVVTGWGTDPVGEMGVGGFYIAQLRGPRFIALLLFLFFFKAVFFAPRTIAGRIEALSTGYAMGRRAAPLFGLNWAELWNVPLEEVRRQLNIDARQATGDGIQGDSTAQIDAAAHHGEDQLSSKVKVA